MPTRAEYEELTLADAIRWLAELPFDTRTRHLSADEYEVLNRAADVIPASADSLRAF